jgi:hypothetical protein
VEGAGVVSRTHPSEDSNRALCITASPTPISTQSTSNAAHASDMAAACFSTSATSRWMTTCQQSDTACSTRVIMHVRAELMYQHYARLDGKERRG